MADGGALSKLALLDLLIILSTAAPVSQNVASIGKPKVLLIYKSALESNNVLP